MNNRPPTLDPAARAATRWADVAAWALVVLAAVLACNQVWDSDVPWHLRSGQWMLDHLQVLGHDPFATPENPAAGPTPWVNVHWGFEVLIAFFHRLGGYAALVALKMAVFAGTIGVFAFYFRRRVSPAWMFLVGLIVVVIAESRIRERPEILTFALLTATLAILDSVRQGALAKRLWWLVPINVLWANSHGLFFVGPLTAWAMVGGAWLDRRLGRETFGNLASGKALLAVGAATAACLATPWPLGIALHPLLLRTRVTGENLMYTYGVDEFRPTYQMNPMGNIGLMLAYGLVALTLAAVAGLLLLELTREQKARVPLGHLLLLPIFLFPAATAIRNVMLMAFPLGFLLCQHGGALLDELRRHRPGLARAAVPTLIVELAVTVLLMAGVATEYLYRWQNRGPMHLGFGAASYLQPTDMAAWLARSGLSGDILPLDFGTGGTFIYRYDDVRDGPKVWMDGRLELHSLARFERLYEIRTKMLSSAQAGDPAELPLPPSVRFVEVPLSQTKHIEALRLCPRFRLVYVDPAGVCFARIPLPGETVTWPTGQPLPSWNAADYDRAVDPATLASSLPVPTDRHWYRQNTLDVNWQLGTIFYGLGQYNLAARYLTVSDRLGLRDRLTVRGLLAQCHQRLNEMDPIEVGSDLPVDPHVVQALALYANMDLSDLRDESARVFALVRIRSLITDRQLDSAEKAISTYLANLPVPERWRPSEEAMAVRDAIKAAYASVTRRKAALDLTGLLPAEKAQCLIMKDLGLIDEAVEQLRQASELPPRGRMLLGDLLLRKGMCEEARRQYLQVQATAGSPPIAMRLALCDWGVGDYGGAEAKLKAANEPAARLYLALLREQFGNYAGASKAIEGFAADGNTPLGQLHDRIKTRLLMTSGFGPAAPGR